jgi:hypothetical protein
VYIATLPEMTFLIVPMEFRVWAQWGHTPLSTSLKVARKSFVLNLMKITTKKEK